VELLIIYTNLHNTRSGMKRKVGMQRNLLQQPTDQKSNVKQVTGDE
jgi:hypothetical protein